MQNVKRGWRFRASVGATLRMTEMQAKQEYKERLAAMVQILREMPTPPNLDQLLFLVKHAVKPVPRAALSFEVLAENMNAAIARAGIKGTIKAQSLQVWETQGIKSELRGDSYLKIGVYIGLDPEIAPAAIAHFLKTGKQINKKAPSEISLGEVLGFVAERASEEELISLLHVAADRLARLIETQV